MWVRRPAVQGQRRRNDSPGHEAAGAHPGRLARSFELFLRRAVSVITKSIGRLGPPNAIRQSTIGPTWSGALGAGRWLSRNIWVSGPGATLHDTGSVVPGSKLVFHAWRDF